jgi:hypothetical protein
MGELTGYARCSTVLQDLTAQRQALAALGIPDDRIYLDQGLTGTSRARPGLDQALAAVRPATPSSYPSSTGSPAPSPDAQLHVRPAAPTDQLPVLIIQEDLVQLRRRRHRRIPPVCRRPIIRQELNRHAS